MSTPTPATTTPPTISLHRRENRSAGHTQQLLVDGAQIVDIDSETVGERYTLLIASTSERYCRLTTTTLAGAVFAHVSFHEHEHGLGDDFTYTLGADHIDVFYGPETPHAPTATLTPAPSHAAPAELGVAVAEAVLTYCMWRAEDRTEQGFYAALLATITHRRTGEPIRTPEPAPVTITPA